MAKSYGLFFRDISVTYLVFHQSVLNCSMGRMSGMGPVYFLFFLCPPFFEQQEKEIEQRPDENDPERTHDLPTCHERLVTCS